MPRRLLKHLFAILVLLIVAGCTGGGCGGCAGCGVTPLPDGFKAEARVENAGSARLTQSGVTFLQNNIGALSEKLLGGMGSGGVVTFEVPTSSGSQFGIDYEVCAGGPKPNGNPPACVAELDIGKAKLNIKTAAPHNITISGPLPLRIQKLPIHITYFGFIESDIDVVLNDGAVCPAGPKPFSNVNVTVNISIEIDTNPAHCRHGASKVVVGDIVIDEDALQADLGFCGGFDAGILDALKGIIFGQLIGPLKETLKEQVDQLLTQPSAQMANPACPCGAKDEGGICKYADGTPMPIMLGTEGHMNLGSLLSSLSPGTKGGLDFLFAAGGENGNPPWGNLNPINGGATLGMYGGALPQPQSSCVKLANMAPPQGIPIPDEITANTVSNWPGGMAGPHVGIALNERFFNYALSGMYDSGLLCIGIGGEQLNFGAISFNSDLFGTFLGAKSVKRLGLQDETQNLALVVRPATPPSAVFGNGTDIDNDPLIRIGLKSMAIDFYVWSLDRYIRFMTYTVDVDLPLNLTVTPEGLVPVLNKINLTNAQVSNASLLTDDPTKIAQSLTDIVSSQLGTALGGAIPAINLNDQLGDLGLTLNIPETVDGQGSPGLRKLSKGSDNYLGVFASLGIAAPAPPQNETKADIVHKEIDVAGLALATWTETNAPKVRIAMTSQQDSGAQVIEYQLRVDGGFWRPWTTKRELEVSQGSFRIQGKHRIEVRSRVAGQPETMDLSPEVLEFAVDASPPVVRVKQAGQGKVEIVVKDAVSALEAVLVRYRLDSGSWSDWIAANNLPLLDASDAETVDVEAKDEEGLIGTAAQAIRGKPVISADGCGCTVAGDDSGDGKALGLLGALVLGIALRFGKRRAPKAEAKRAAKSADPVKISRRLRALTSIAMVATAGCFAGCNCGGDTENTSSSDNTSSSSGTTTNVKCPTCDVLYPGFAGEYASAVAVGDTLYVAGYVEKSISEMGDRFSWGDLAVGKYNGTNVDWQLIDGVPDEAVDPKAYDPDGFRGGVVEPGDDVGLWTSIAADDKGTLGVAYYDRTHRSLKFALQAGEKWTVSTVQEKAASDLGRYAKLLWNKGSWTIAFLAAEPGENGAVTSGVRIATSPSGSDWAFEDASQNKATPCAARYCATGTACIKDTGLCTAELAKSACDPTCTSSQACVDAGGGAGACADKVTPSALETYPEASGDYIAIALEKGGTPGIVFYDRVKGNLVMASKASGQWVSTILDGEANGVDTGDVGIGATLAIDSSGVWHIAYSNGHDESLQYMSVVDGKPGTPEVIDDGAGIEGTPFDDGRHIVGDDANIYVAPGGDILVSYQDATAGTLHLATGTAGANGHSWAVKVVPQEGFAGAFSRIVDVQGTVMVTHWYRQGGDTYVGDIAVVKP